MERVNPFVTTGIMLLYMVKSCCIVKGFVIPVQATQPTMNSRKATPDIFDVTLEMLHIYRIEPDYSGEKSDISLGDLIAEIKRCR